jgi:hypothetical protein
MKLKLTHFGLFAIILIMISLAVAGCTSQTTPAEASKTPTVTATPKTVDDTGCAVVLNDRYNSRADMYFSDLRGYRFAEVFLLCGDTSSCYNTAGLNTNMDSPKDSVPDSLIANFSEEEVAAQYHVPGVYLNGPKIWMLDSMVIPTGEQVRDFDGIKARWMAYSEKSEDTQPYTEFSISRQSTFNWNKGKPAYILDDTSGTPWILKSYNPDFVSESDLNTLDQKLNIPAGWKFRVVTLPEDLIEIPVNGTAYLIQDELMGVWDKATIDGGMNYQP